MNVLVIGANGQVGHQIVNLLHDSKEHSVKALVRKEEQATELVDQGIDTAVASLEDSVDKLSSAMEGSDAVVFAAGSGGSTGSDKTLLVDLDGAVKTMEAAEKLGIKRYVMVSAHQAHNRDNWSEALMPYYAAKHYADKMLEQSALDYTIVRPGGLLNEDGTGQVSIAENLKRGSVSREDVAKVIVALLANENTIRRSFDLISGEDSIEDAIASL
ncbi:SDR family oxidoreductase [Pseudalkalibacillus hwajinpoensis]|uniref:SDR family oxidoreductase n=1 Tax=Guptibacillus hwajinpoensis TaxID=208199 RepID=A0A4U1MGV9_9BACL|nr:SDR family oxidoreductase [Pseudalkalibacillus hwajinpoensis]TKD69957.1 SDR family oxidoreductase [Pseudalkalibacillus hwajinpoensis]